MLTKVKYYLADFQIISLIFFCVYQKASIVIQPVQTQGLYVLSINFGYPCIINPQKLIQIDNLCVLLAFAFTFLFQDGVVHRFFFRRRMTLKHSHNLIADLAER